MASSVDALSQGGSLDLLRYIRMWSEDAPLPPVKALGYMAPPWLIGTYLHWDGGGGQLSVHTYAFGPGYQLIHVYPELPSWQEELFLAEIGLADRSVLPHSFDAEMDCSTQYWDAVHQKRLESKGIVPETVRLVAGQTVVLPPGRAHAFKKCVDKVSETWRTDGLMFSIAGDVSYVGATQASFAREFQRLLYCEEVAIAGGKRVYSLCELALLCLARNRTILRDDVIAAEHLKAATIFVDEFVQRQRAWLAKANGEVTVLEPEEEILLERACQRCYRPLANVMLQDSGCGADEWVCGGCCSSKGRVVASIRFCTMDELEKTKQ